MIALFIPLAVDSALGTLGNCEEPITLIPPAVPDGVSPYTLPNDQEILRTFSASRHLLNICDAPHFFDSKFGRQAEKIVVTYGGLNRAFQPLGNVDKTLRGFDQSVTRFAHAGWGIYGGAPTQHIFYQASTTEVNDALRREALLRFGKQVDAVLNVDSTTTPSNDVNATGLAVRFTD